MLHVNWTILLAGDGLGKPTSVTYEELRLMEMRELREVLMAKTHSSDEITNWRGPSLSSLLEAAQIKAGPVSVTVQAADGYERKCARADLDGAILALQDGQGRWLAALDISRPVRLIVPRKPGDYWISNPNRIIVEPSRPSSADA